MAENTDKSGADGSEGKDKKVEFTPEQQEHVNTIINARFAKVAQKHEEEMKTLRDQMAALTDNKSDKDKADKDKKDKAAADGADDSEEKKQFKLLLDAEKNKAKLAEAAAVKASEEAKQARAESKRTQKEVAIAKAASKFNFYEPDVVQTLVWDKIVESDDGRLVIKEGNIIKQNSSLVDMTLEEYFSEFAAQRPYLVNGDVKSGAGSADSSKNNGAGLVKSKKDLKNAKEKSDFITKFGLDKFEALPLQ